MEISDLRIALFSGNYNCVRDGANQALNRLAGYLLQHGAAVRVYSPTVASPAFAPTGDLISIPSVPFPGRGEYRYPLALAPTIKRDLARFAPNLVHVSSPDVVSHRAISWARARRLPILASVHTRFETYARYYRLGFIEPALEAILRRFYRRCDALAAPSQSMARVLREQRMNDDISIWSRGVDRGVFDPARRSDEWRRARDIADHALAVGFLGRLVMEKGLGVFAETIDELAQRSVPHTVLVIGEGPAKEWLRARLPGAVFTGFLAGADLGRATASMDVLFNPSVTETFGNVTLEAMACAVPVVAAAATGSDSLVVDGVSGRLIAPGAIGGFADAIGDYGADNTLRRRHGEAGERRSRDFTWDAVNGAVAQTYLRLVARKAGG